MPRTKDRVLHATEGAKPYVERALHDEELRDSLKRAAQAARDVYDELIRPRNVTTIAQRLATDSEVQDNLRTTIAELRRATDRLRTRESRRGRNTAFLLLGVIIGVLFNPWTGPETRKWLREQLLGGESELELETTTPSGNGDGVVQ
jgi:hypothetical protein